MWLVDEQAEGAWKETPSLFSPVVLSAVVAAQVHMLAKDTISSIDSHFLTLEFSATGAHVHLSIRYWPVRRQGARVSGDFGEAVYQRV